MEGNYTDKKDFLKASPIQTNLKSLYPYYLIVDLYYYDILMGYTKELIVL